jgi:hypothetical protein
LARTLAKAGERFLATARRNVMAIEVESEPH